MNLKSLSLSILLLPLFLTIGQSQQVFNSSKSIQSARDHIKALNDGVLLVRLPSNYKKVAALTKVLNGDLTDKEYASVSKALNNALEENEIVHTAIISAMYNYYTFSEFAFFLDSDSREVLAEGKKMYRTWPDSTKIDFDLLPGTEAYVLAMDQTAETSLGAFIIKDRGLNEIPLPFPGTIIRSQGDPWIAFWMKKEKRLMIENANNIKRLDRKLWHYFNTPSE